MARTLRPPVIAVMGHIDHGKSSLLDYIRKSNVVAGEAGGITQHVSAYIAEHAGRKVTFLDTPGHEAFKALRARGAAAADIAILVVAADEGVMPQTLDALAAIQEASIPYVVAITKTDKNNADVERAKSSMLEHGIYLEGLGGEIPYAPVSSKSGEGVPELLDLVLLAADLVELSADPEAPASGFVLESSMDPKRGASATLILKDGTLSTKSFVVAGTAYAPVRFIEDFRGKRVEQAGPSEPALVSGFSGLPDAGAPFSVEDTKKAAEASARANAKSDTASSAPAAEGAVELPLIVKSDVAGSIDAIAYEIGKLPQERVSARIIASGVGSVSENDVKTATAGGAVIIAFNVGTDSVARDLAERDGVRIESFSIIYELSEKVAELLAARAPKMTLEEELGRAKILKTFSSSAKKQVLGARLLSGTMTVGSMVKIVRQDAEIARGKIDNLQQARADVKEIRTEGEFGLEIAAKADAAPGDEIIVFRTVES
jgi:translation initiation factor IF-2